MNIEVNGELKEFENNADLNFIVNSFVDDTKGIAIAVNNSVVPRNQWVNTSLQDNDKVLIIKATQGG